MNSKFLFAQYSDYSYVFIAENIFAKQPWIGRKETILCYISFVSKLNNGLVVLFSIKKNTHTHANQ